MTAWQYARTDMDIPAARIIAVIFLETSAIALCLYASESSTLMHNDRRRTTTLLRSSWPSLDPKVLPQEVALPSQTDGGPTDHSSSLLVNATRVASQ